MPGPTVFRLTPDQATIAAEAVRAEADRRRRAGIRAATGLAADRRAGKDIRGRAVKVIDLLATADELDRLGDLMGGGDSTSGPAVAELDDDDGVATDDLLTRVTATAGGDGTSAAAQAAAELAGLEPTVLTETTHDGLCNTADAKTGGEPCALPAGHPGDHDPDAPTGVDVDEALDALDAGALATNDA